MNTIKKVTCIRLTVCIYILVGSGGSDSRMCQQDSSTYMDFKGMISRCDLKIVERAFLARS